MSNSSRTDSQKQENSRNGDRALKSFCLWSFVVAMLFVGIYPSAAYAEQTTSLPSSDAETSHSLTIDIIRPPGMTGTVVVGLYTIKKGFPDNISLADHRITLSSEESTYTFSGLAPGPYVGVAFLDNNQNGKLDKSVIGMPKEPIGLSNHPKLAPPRPSFEKAQVEVPRVTSVSIRLQRLGR
jgi:uncharacterized protein (DUF2141 family)